MKINVERVGFDVCTTEVYNAHRLSFEDVHISYDSSEQADLGQRIQTNNGPSLNVSGDFPTRKNQT